MSVFMRGPPVADGSGLTRGIFEARRLREIDAGGRVGLEGTPEAELLAHVAQRRQDFLTEQPDARLRVLVRDEAIRGPEADDRRARLFEQTAQLRDDGLRRARDDLLVPDLILERGAARVGASTDRVFDEGRAI